MSLDFAELAEHSHDVTLTQLQVQAADVDVRTISVLVVPGKLRLEELAPEFLLVELSDLVDLVHMSVGHDGRFFSLSYAVAD